MFTPLRSINLTELFEQPIMLDANILMVGIENRVSDPNCCFENIKTLFLIPIINSFQNIIIHEEVYRELDDDCKQFLTTCNNITIVCENGLYGKDPQYTSIFNNISEHDRVQYIRMNSKDKGEVFSLAYAAFHKINYFSSKEIMVDEIVREINDLKGIHIITFDIIVLIAFVYYNSQKIKNHNRALKSSYKKYCEDVIKRHSLPSTLGEYIQANEAFI